MGNGIYAYHKPPAGAVLQFLDVAAIPCHTFDLNEVIGVDGGALFDGAEGFIRTRARLLAVVDPTKRWLVKVHDWPTLAVSEWVCGTIGDGGWTTVVLKPFARTVPLWPCPLVFGSAACGVRARPGDACDKTFETCRDRFHNEARFQGMTDSEAWARGMRR